MTRVIWKFLIPTQGFLEILMPSIADILCVQAQGGGAYIWALVETESKGIRRYFRLYGTGNEVTHESGQYIGTFQTLSHEVYHLFEVDDDD